jgi:hypothetical protein
MAERLRTGLASGHSAAGVTGAIMLLVALQDHTTHRTAAHGELRGVPASYATAFGPLATAPGPPSATRGGTVTLGHLHANQVYINQAAAQALGARAGDRLQLLIGGQPVPTGPSTLYFAAGHTGQARTITSDQPIVAEEVHSAGASQGWAKWGGAGR